MKSRTINKNVNLNSEKIFIPKEKLKILDNKTLNNIEVKFKKSNHVFVIFLILFIIVNLFYDAKHIFKKTVLTENGQINCEMEVVGHVLLKRNIIKNNCENIELLEKEGIFVGKGVPIALYIKDKKTRKLKKDLETINEEIIKLNNKSKNEINNLNKEKKEILTKIKEDIIFSPCVGTISLINEEKTKQNVKFCLSKFFKKNIEQNNVKQLSIISDTQWIFETTLPNFKTNFTPFEKVFVRLENVSEPIPMQVKQITKQNDMFNITLTSENYVYKVYKNNTVNAKIIKIEAEGIKIPLKAIKIKKGKIGVYSENQNHKVFKPIEIVAKDEKTAIIKSVGEQPILVHEQITY